MAREISRLPVPQSYQLQLVEVFSAFHWHLDRLMTILRPAAQRLDYKAEKTLRRRRQTRQREKDSKAAGRKPWAAPSGGRET